MTIEQFNSAISQIDEWCNGVALHVNTTAAMNNTLFHVAVPGGANRRISFIKDPSENDYVHAEYMDGETFSDMCLVGTSNINMTSIAFQAALIKNWKTIKADIEREIDSLDKKATEMERRMREESAEQDRIEREIVASVPDEFEL